MADDPFDSLRHRMVEDQLVARGIRDARVLEAMRAVARERFVPASHRCESYEDRPVPVGAGQTISQPYMVALMTECLKIRPGERVLEIGTGSGYQTALLSWLGLEVYSIERLPALAEQAGRFLRDSGVEIEKVRIRVRDGSLGWPQEAPFDKILVTASAPSVPEPLLAQLADPGRLVIPVGEMGSQWLLVVEKVAGALKRRSVCECAFVPLIGEAGWPEDPIRSEEE